MKIIWQFGRKNANLATILYYLIIFPISGKKGFILYDDNPEYMINWEERTTRRIENLTLYGL